MQPHFDCCSHIWGCLGKGLPDKLPKLQNRTFRITHENYETRTADVLNKAGIPDLKSRREYQLAVLTFKIKIKTLPNPLTELFANTTMIRDIANLILLYLSLKQTA